MGWLLRKIDQVFAVVLGGGAAVVLSQFQAFTHQYLQRLGGHLEEARRSLEQIGSAPQYATLDGASRQLLVDAASQRVGEIEAARNAILGADSFTRPFVFLRELDPGIARGALHDFQPAVPLDTVSLAYAAVALVTALLLYDLVKAPFRLSFRGRRRRVY